MFYIIVNADMWLGGDAMDPHFNAALDELRGKGTERALAERLGVSLDTLQRYRHGGLPWCVRQLALFPTLLQALARDAECSAAESRRQ